MKRSIGMVVVTIAAVALIATTTPAQAPPAPSTNDVNVALVRELHDLRIAIEKLASAGSRIQVLSTRTSQQEQRISNLMNQLIAMNSKLAEASADAARKAFAVQEVNEALRTVSDPQELKAVAIRQREVVLQADEARAAQASIQAQADAIRQQMIIEQSTLSDLQRKLDELDRSMGEPR